MTKFSDQLFTDLMREHQVTLRDTELPAATTKHPLRRRAWLAAGGVAAAATALTVGLAGFGSSPAYAAYAVTAHPDGTVTVAIRQMSGISGANAALRKVAPRVYVVPVRPGCPSMNSLPAPAVRPKYLLRIQTGVGRTGSVTVDAKGIPAGDILVVAVQSTVNGNMHMTMGASRLTSPPPPSCVSLPKAPPPPPGGGQVSGSSSGSVSGSGSGQGTVQSAG